MSATLGLLVPVDGENGGPRYPKGPDPAELLAAAIHGDRDAKKDLVLRYSSLVRRVISQYRLTATDMEDVYQTVWMRLWEHLDRIRVPQALPGWITTTAKNEALKVATSNRRLDLADPQNDARFDSRSEWPELADELLRIEKNQALQSGLAQLEPKHRNLLLLLHSEPQVSYREISMRLGIPMGSIGPTRARCIKKLRATTSVTTLLHTETDIDLPATA